MVIRTNMSALRTYRSGAKTSAAIAKNLEKLASGCRINRAADDASGLAVSERMRANISELGRCRRNAAEGLDLAKTADGALAEVNDMLRRARELCVQAANGTYSEQELACISDEMNQLFSEVDRITAASSFNDIQLFRSETEQDFHYEYDETFTALPAGDLAVWGAMDFVKTEPFIEPQQAKAATATFRLDDSVNFNDVNSLNGYTIQIDKYTFYFTDGTVNVPNHSDHISISLKTYSTTDRALNRFAELAKSKTSQSSPASKSYPIVSDIIIDKDARTITLAAPLHDLDAGTFEADGETFPNMAPQGDGAWANETIAAQNPPGSSSLNQVDGQNNAPVYSDTASAAVNLSYLGSTLTAADAANLTGNTLHIGGRILPLRNLSPAPAAGMTRDNFGSNLAAAISGLHTNYQASYDSAAKQINVTLKNQSPTSGSAGYIYESCTSAHTHRDNHPMFTGSALNLNFNITTPASGERPEVCEITVPQTAVPFSYSVNGTNYLYYDSSQHSFLQPGDSGTLYNNSASAPRRVDVKGKDRAWIIGDIADKISAQSGVGAVRVNGDKITAAAGSLNSPMNLSSKFRGVSISVVSYKTVVDKPGTSPVFGGGYTYFQKTAAASFSLGKDLNALIGSGFRIDYRDPSYSVTTTDQFEFTNGTSLHAAYTDIDISGCTTFTQLRDKVQQVMGNTYTVTLDQTDPNNTKLLISRQVSGNVTVTDGVTGIRGLISGSEPARYAGGTNTGYCQKAIDFSSINSENLTQLLGKGFRINCATCEGEYINVFFCWENEGRAPERFDITYDGALRTIHNISVELSKVNSADQIVQSIVEQVRPTLKHFTDVAVGTPATVLLARDKRIGTVQENGVIKLGEVQTGLEANFTYSVNIRKVEDYPADGSVAIKNTEVEIYVGSEPDSQIIPIHLPHLDMKTLRLRPPEAVDLNSSEQNASDWLTRVDRANLAISEVRGVIGADYNRLEHAVQSLSHSRENLADAESRIRDTDMAEEMMEHVKLQILTQAQQSMLSQASARPQQVLSLIS